MCHRQENFFPQNLEKLGGFLPRMQQHLILPPGLVELFDFAVPASTKDVGGCGLLRFVVDVTELFIDPEDDNESLKSQPLRKERDYTNHHSNGADQKIQGFAGFIHHPNRIEPGC
jgi:hypothetical protein